MLKRKYIYITLTLIALLCATIVLGRGYIIAAVGGAFEHQPEDLNDKLSESARKLLEDAFDGLDKDRLFDYHTHLVGVGKSGTGCYVNKKMLDWTHPWERTRFKVFADAAGIRETVEDPDAAYVERLVRLVRGFEGNGKHLLLALDQHYNEDGTPNSERTEYYVPNDYAWEIAEKYPSLFVPALSVHPYRKDAIEALARLAERGARTVKWIPNAMGIDPTDPRCLAFFRAMLERDMTLLTHAGHEKAVEAEADQKYGNPLLYRRALDMGVRIIMAHAAGLGSNADLDNPGASEVPNFELFMRLMDDARYEGLLFADISAITQFNRLPVPLTTLLERTDLHYRLVNGSDYPLPAVNMLIQMDALVSEELITETEADALAEIYDFNPLLFDFAVKRTVKLPGQDAGFPHSVFMVNEALRP